MSNPCLVQTMSYEDEFPPLGGLPKAVNYELEGEPEAEGSAVMGAGVRVQVPKQDGSMAQVNISEYI